MSFRFRIILVMSGSLVVLAAGCGWYCRRAAFPNEIAASYPPEPVFGYTPQHPLTPSGVAPIGPQARVVPTPMVPNGPAVVSPPASSNGTWQPPSQAGVRDQTRPDTRLLPLEPAPSNANEPVKPAINEQREPAPNHAERPMPSLPVGIPQFTGVRDRVSAGLKPLLDGLDWLKSAGYRSVLHIRAPGTDDAADRREIEKRGLRYLSLELSPQSLSPTIVEQFNRIVGDTANQPLFVYDKDGLLAGALWYIHFRTVDQLNDDAARIQAARLGLKDAANEEQRAMWLAVQKYLSTQPRAN